MATIEIKIDDEKIQQLLQGDRGMAVLLEPILNQILQAEMTEHLKAKPGEQTDDRRGYRNGTYERKLTTRVGTIELEVPLSRGKINIPVSSVYRLPPEKTSEGLVKERVDFIPVRAAQLSLGAVREHGDVLSV